MRKNLKTSTAAKNSTFTERVLVVPTEILSRSNPDGSLVVMHMDYDEFFFTLDHVAAEFFKMIDGKKSIQAICEKLEKKHNPPRGVLEKEVRLLVKQLVQEKIVRLS